MIGEFVPARRASTDRAALLIGVDLNNSLALVSDEGGRLEVVGIEEISINWHYDGGDGKWKPDFDEG